MVIVLVATHYHDDGFIVTKNTSGSHPREVFIVDLYWFDKGFYHGFKVVIFFVYLSQMLLCLLDEISSQ